MPQRIGQDAEAVAGVCEVRRYARARVNAAATDQKGAYEVLHLAPVGWYADWFLSRVSGKVDMDRDAIAARFAALGEEVPMKRYPDRLRAETREEFQARLKRETAKAAKELHRRPVAAHFPAGNTRAPVPLVAEAGALRCAKSGSVRSGTVRSPRWTSSTRRPPPASRGRGS